MGEEVRISVSRGDGSSQSVSIDKFSSVRSILNLADISVPEDSSCVFAIGDRVLTPDLSLDFQNVQDGDHIVVILRKKRTQKRTRLFGDDSVTKQLAEIEESNMAYCLESLRLADVSFLIFESSKARKLLYLKELAEQSCQYIPTRRPIPTVIPQPTETISDTPLPRCWMSDDMPSPFTILPPSPSIRGSILQCEKSQRNVDQNLFL